MSWRALAGVTGSLTGPKPSTSSFRFPAGAVSSTLNAVCSSPRSILASRFRAAVDMTSDPAWWGLLVRM
jgi:hypothetical protein